MVQFQRLAPPDALRPWVACLTVIEHNGPARTADPQRVTPDGCVELNFNLGAPLLRTTATAMQRLVGAYVACRHARPYFVQRTGSTQVISVRFHPWGVPRLPGMAVHELADEAIAAGEVFGPEVRSVEEEVLNTMDRTVALGRVTEFLVRTLPTYTTDALVIDAARQLSGTQETHALRKLEHRYGISARRLQQRFHEHMGMAPKAFLRLVRFQRALRGLQQGASCLDVAFDQGYSDQSHLVREFKAFAGLPPFRYGREAHPLNDAMLL